MLMVHKKTKPETQMVFYAGSAMNERISKKEDGGTAFGQAG